MSNDNTWFGDSTLGERFPAWTRGNAADVFPEPFSPLGQSLVMRQGMCTGLRDAYVWIGALDVAKVIGATGISPEWRPVALLPIGYRGETPVRTSRRPLAELVHEFDPALLFPLNPQSVVRSPTADR